MPVSRRVLYGLVHRVTQDVVLVLGDAERNVVTELGALFAEHRLPTEVRAQLIILIRYIHDYTAYLL